MYIVFCPAPGTIIAMKIKLTLIQIFQVYTNFPHFSCRAISSGVPSAWIVP